MIRRGSEFSRVQSSPSERGRRRILNVFQMCRLSPGAGFSGGEVEKEAVKQARTQDSTPQTVHPPPPPPPGQSTAPSRGHGKRTFRTGGTLLLLLGDGFGAGREGLNSAVFFPLGLSGNFPACLGFTGTRNGRRGMFLVQKATCLFWTDFRCFDWFARERRVPVLGDAPAPHHCAVSMRGARRREDTQNTAAS